jgi:hypothetical protein
VLDDEPISRGRPLDEGPPSLRRERDPERKLMIRAHDDCRDVRQLIDAQALVVDADRHDLEARGRQGRSAPAVPGVFDGDALRAEGPQDACDDEQGL